MKPATWWPVGHAIRRPEWGVYRSPEWHLMRDSAAYLGCSQVAGALDLNPYEGPLGTWNQLMGDGRKPDEEAQVRMELGSDVEALLAKWWRKRCPEVVTHWRPKSTFSHPRFPFMGASFDAVGYLDTGEQVLAEFKHLSHWYREQVEAYVELGELGELGGYIGAIYVQCQSQLAVSGLRLAYLCILVEKAIHPIRIERDERAISRIEREIPAFWRRYVETGEEPPAGACDTKLLRERYADVDPGLVVERPDLDETVRKAREIKARLAKANAKVRAVEKELAPQKSKLMQAMGKAEVLRVGGDVKPVTWKADKNGKRTMRI